jgi:hypothetical protein
MSHNVHYGKIKAWGSMSASLVRANADTPSLLYISIHSHDISIAPRQSHCPALLLLVIRFVSDAQWLHLPDVFVLVVSL